MPLISQPGPSILSPEKRLVLGDPSMFACTACHAAARHAQSRPSAVLRSPQVRYAQVFFVQLTSFGRPRAQGVSWRGAGELRKPPLDRSALKSARAMSQVVFRLI